MLYLKGDQQSHQIASYFATVRGIPTPNVLAVDIQPDNNTLPSTQFAAVHADVKARMPETVQALTLAWTYPYRVDCMSITSAFAFGFDQDFCAEQCQPTKQNPYFASRSSMPYRDLAIRPTMMLAGRTEQNTRLLIDRGRQSDGRHPRSKAYFVITDDPARNTRIPRYFDAVRTFLGRFPVEIMRSEALSDVDDVMFYFTGSKRVEKLETLGFLPGAVADHLTSAGGILDGTGQMTVLSWLEAGATASYGTVVEPCNFPEKFPDPVVMMEAYLGGESAIEAYWKSVAWPGQGLFVGEPLASPFSPNKEPVH